MTRFDELRERLEADIAAGRSQRELAAEYGVARSTIQDWLKKLDRTAADRRAGVVVTSAELERARVVELGRTAKKLRDKVLTGERLVDEIRQGVEAMPQREFNVPPLPAPHEPKPHVHNLLLSDTHAFEVVDAKAMNGINAYDWDICQKRMWKIRDSLASFQRNRPYAIGELHLSVLGDMVNGDNHDELRETNEASVAVQAITFGGFLAKWVESLLEVYPKIVVRCVAGNHGRTHKPPSSKLVFDSYDWIAYKVAEVALANYIEAGVIEFDAPESAMIVAEIGGQNILLMHGDGIRSTMPGVPWGGVMRRWGQLYAQYAHQGILLDGVQLGHFHQACVVPFIWMNGSVKGPDEYVLKNFGFGQDATQLLLTFNPEKKRLTDVSYITP